MREPANSSASAAPLVSVCVPTVNRFSYLEKALTSVIAQTFRGWELVIGENSGDGEYARQVRRLVAELTAGVSNQVRIIHQDVQLSMVSHTNALIGAARGTYVLYLPDDDWLHETCLERLSAPVLSDRATDVVFSDHWVVRVDGTIDAGLTAARTRRCGLHGLRPGKVPSDYVMALALRQSWQLQAMLIRRTMFEAIPFREEKANLLDFDFQLRLARQEPPPQVAYCPERLVYYRLHPSQVTKSWPIEQRVMLYRDCIASLEECNPVPPAHASLYRRKMAQSYGALASCYWRDRKWMRAWESALGAVRADPAWMQGYALLIRPLIPTAGERWLQDVARSVLAAIEAKRGTGRSGS